MQAATHPDWNNVSKDRVAQDTLDRSRVRGCMRVAALLLLIAIAFLPVLLCWAARCDRVRARLVQGFFVIVCMIIGIRSEHRGKIDSRRPLMMVSNHAGYLDVFVLGSIAPVSFTPKREVRTWPIIGFFCVLADCVFVERKPSHMQQARKSMRKRLNRDKILCLFPEGTTSDNSTVIPFKSGFFSLAENDEGEEPLPVQPVTLAFTSVGRTPMREAWRAEIAWVGDDTFFDHFWRVLKLPSIQTVVQFHSAQTLPYGASRKLLSKTCERMIADGLKQIHSER
jgi:lyso-ornithine lipid O-acyltransferase